MAVYSILNIAIKKKENHRELFIEARKCFYNLIDFFCSVYNVVIDWRNYLHQQISS